MLGPNNILPTEQFTAYTRRLEDIMLFSKVIRNWHQVVLFRAGLMQSVTIVMRSGKKVEINGKADYTRFFGSPEFQRELLAAQGHRSDIKISGGWATLTYKGRKLKFVHTLSLNELPGLIDQFVKGEYKQLDVNGRKVIDVGASIGDSAIYFALNGATHVYAFEPYPYPYRVAKRNVAANRLAGRVTLLNEGLGTPDFLKLKTDVENTVGIPASTGKSGKVIRITSLKEIVKRYGITDGALKIDCEGFEYQILLDADEGTLRSFSSMAIEYHYGHINIVKKLRSAGFSVEHTHPRMMPGPDGWWMHIGMIYAKREGR